MEGVPVREKSMRNALQKQGMRKCFGETINSIFLKTGIQLLYNVLVSAIQQSESVIHIHIYPL